MYLRVVRDRIRSMTDGEETHHILQMKQIKFIPIEWSITISLFIPNTGNKPNYIRRSYTTRTQTTYYLANTHAKKNIT